STRQFNPNASDLQKSRVFTWFGKESTTNSISWRCFEANMSQIATKELLSEIAKRHGFRLDSDDPAIAIVSLNQLVFEKSVQELCDCVGAAVGNIESTAKKAE